ncbi:MAG: hypothetical protein ABII90_12295 [Bacteroidota bacterium]
MKNTTLHLAERLFWDTDFSLLDPDRHDQAIITRAFDYGTWEDVKETLAYYGEKRVKKCLTTSSSLRHGAIGLACSVFNLQPKDFKCYTKKRYLKSS